MSAFRVQFLLDEIRDVRLAGPRKARQPNHARLLPLEIGVGTLVDLDRLPFDDLRSPQSLAQHAGGDGVVGDAVDQDEAAGVAILGVGIKGDRPVEFQFADADFVEVQLLGLHMFQSVDVDLVFQGQHGRGNGLRADLHQIASAAQHRLLAHPNDGRLELIADLGRCVGGADQVAARDVDFVGQRQRHRLIRHRDSEIAVLGDDARHRGFLARRHHADSLTLPNETADQRAGEAAEIEVRPIHPLHRHPKRLLLQPLLVDLHRLQQFHQRRAGIPRRVDALLDDVVALHAGDRNDMNVVQSDA